MEHRPHPASPQRRALARAAGVVLTSPALTAAAALAAGLAVALLVAIAAARAVTASARAQLAGAADATDLGAAALDLPRALLAIAGPVALAAAGGALLGHVAITRGLWLPRRALRGAPSAGADAARAGERLVDAALAIGRAAILLAVAVAATARALPPLARADSAAALLALTGRAVAAVAIAALALAVVELAVRWRRLERSLAMSDAERKAELRELVGDPHVRQARRAARADRPELGDARVVIVADDVAVAIGWRPGAPPHRAARGRGLEARRLVSLARAAAVPLVADAALATALHDAASLEPHFPALAAVLAAVGVSAPAAASR